MIGWSFILFCTAVFVWVSLATLWDKRPVFLKPLALGTLGVLWAVTAGVLVLRFTRGLGAVSNMSDQFPWGVWIGLDVMSGVVLAAGGYVICGVIHLFRLERFQSVLRPTVLTAFLGYNFVALALLVDIGRPYRLWHPLVMWQHHSIMFEVAWCVTLYSTVLAIEFSPVIFDRFGLTLLRNLVKKVTIPIVILGVILSTLHQSSLGSLFLVMPEKLHPLWYSPLLPVFFLVSSVAVGMCMTVVESTYSAKVFGKSLETLLLSELGRAAGLVLLIYALVKAVDLAARGAWTRLWPLDLQSAMFFLEMAMGVVIPAVLLLNNALRKKYLLLASGLVIVGIVLNRINVSWIGMLTYAGPVYFPSWMEMAVTLSFVTAGIVVFGLGVKFLPVFEPEHEGARAGE